MFALFSQAMLLAWVTCSLLYLQSHTSFYTQPRVKMKSVFPDEIYYFIQRLLKCWSYHPLISFLYSTHQLPERQWVNIAEIITTGSEYLGFSTQSPQPLADRELFLLTLVSRNTSSPQSYACLSPGLAWVAGNSLFLGCCGTEYCCTCLCRSDAGPCL